jgi:hypothetical protein
MNVNHSIWSELMMLNSRWAPNLSFQGAHTLDLECLEGVVFYLSSRAIIIWVVHEMPVHAQPHLLMIGTITQLLLIHLKLVAPVLECVLEPRSIILLRRSITHTHTLFLTTSYLRGARISLCVFK